MERREDIRAAMQSLLTPAPRREPRPQEREPRSQEREPTIERADPSGPICAGTRSTIPIRMPDMQMETIMELQRALRENGIAAEPAEIIQALCQAVAVRPALCRSLLASYLTGIE